MFKYDEVKWDALINPQTYNLRKFKNGKFEILKREIGVFWNTMNQPKSTS